MSNKIVDLFLPFKQKSRDLEEENEQLKSFLSTVPVEYCGWDQLGAMAVSPGFGLMMGIEKISTIEDVEAALSPGDAAALQGAFSRLKKYGENFEITVNTLSSRKTLKIFGKRGAVGDGSNVFSVIWLYDITEFANAAISSMESVTSVEKRKHELISSLNSFPFPMWIRNNDLDITWCNKNYTKLADESLASIIADQKELSVTDVDKKQINVRVMSQKAVANKNIQKSRGHKIVDGKRKLFELMEIPFDGETKSVGVAFDVTREEEWEDSYNRIVKSYNEAMEQLRTAIAMFDADMSLEFYNSAYEQLTGMSGSWLDQKPRMAEIIDKMRELRKLPEQADYKQYKDNWAIMFTSLIEPVEETQYLSDGTVLRMIIVPRPMGGLMLTLEDVTSHLQLETSYNTLMAVQQETMNNLAEGVAVFGEDGRLKLCNHAFGTIFELMPEDLTSAPHVSKLVKKMQLAFENDNSEKTYEVILKNALQRDSRKGRIMQKNGNVIEYSVVPLPDGNILNAYVDVTDTIKVEQALQEKNNALQEAEQLKTDFIANVSYQLRTPLNAIMGFSEMLHKEYVGELNESQRDYTKHIIESGQRLTSLINDILDLSSIEAGKLVLRKSEVNICSLIESIVSLTEDWGRKQNVKISYLCSSTNLNILVDEVRIKQVLLNLISNAFNYSNKGGEVIVSVEEETETNSILVKVKDNGIGISEEDLSRIFTPFDRINSGKTEKRRGAGLGLTLVNSIIELHGGEVSVESNEGEGTLVICRLPLE